MMTGIPYLLNPLLPAGTAWHMNKGKPDEYVLADCIETIQQLVAALNSTPLK